MDVVSQRGVETLMTKQLPDGLELVGVIGEIGAHHQRPEEMRVHPIDAEVPLPQSGGAIAEELWRQSSAP